MKRRFPFPPAEVEENEKAKTSLRGPWYEDATKRGQRQSAAHSTKRERDFSGRAPPAPGGMWIHVRMLAIQQTGVFALLLALAMQLHPPYIPPPGPSLMPPTSPSCRRPAPPAPPARPFFGLNASKIDIKIQGACCDRFGFEF